MAREVTVEIRADWREAEPEGTKCYACGDMCLLTETVLIVTVAGLYESEPVASLCGSCAESVSDRGAPCE